MRKDVEILDKVGILTCLKSRMSFILPWTQVMLNHQLPLDQTLTALFQEYGLPLGIQPQRATVQYSNKGAQFQCNGALASAKMLKQNPRQLAQVWIAHF